MGQDNIREQIKERLDIVDVISDYVSLKKSGQNYKGLCPFHSEKTPSFMVSQSKQIFHCFGCGTGGDVFSFLMKHENLTYPEALRILAKRAGVKISTRAFSGGTEKDTLKAMQKVALDYFKEELRRSVQATSYLEKRGIKKESIEKFSLGYAPDNWHGLYELLRKNGFQDSVIANSGLVSRGQKGFYDIFRARLMFPIFDTFSEVIAFGGRVLDDSMPKYLNSSDTPIFKKSETLYALHMAVDEIKKSGYAIVVEGYLDAIACHQAGFKNAVAPLGTALTAGHLRKLSRYSGDILLVFDGDKAGIMAARRALPGVFEQGLRAKVLLLPEGEDPDSLLKRKDGTEKFKALIEDAATPIGFLLKTAGGEKTEAIKEVLTAISKAKDGIFKEELISELAGRSALRERALREWLKQLQTGKRLQAEKSVSTGQDCQIGKEEALLLNIMLFAEEKVKEIASLLSPEEVESTLLKKALKVSSLNRLFEDSDEKETAILRKLAIKQEFDQDEVDRCIKDCIRNIKLRHLESQIMQARAEQNLKVLNRLLRERKSLFEGGI